MSSYYLVFLPDRKDIFSELKKNKESKTRDKGTIKRSHIIIWLLEGVPALSMILFPKEARHPMQSKYRIFTIFVSSGLIAIKRFCRYRRKCPIWVSKGENKYITLDVLLDLLTNICFPVTGQGEKI